MTRMLAMPSIATSIASSFALLIACRGPEAAPPTPRSSASTPHAVPAEATSSAQVGGAIEVPLEARSDAKLSGKATFTETPDGVRMVMDVAGISPGKHGVHVHEKGDCSAPDAMSAGAHFSPEGHPHGLPPTQPRHLGDLGNLEAGEDGRAHFEAVAPHANLQPGDRRSFVDRSIIVHAKPDDGSQPSGNSGARIGCGVIRP